MRRRVKPEARVPGPWGVRSTDRRGGRKASGLKECSHIEGHHVSSKDGATLTHRMENTVKISLENLPVGHNTPQILQFLGTGGHRAPV